MKLLALRWSDVDLDAALVHVERSVTQVAQQRIYGTPKNHERRDVSIDAHTVGVLRSWRALQASERLAWGTAYREDEDLVFTWDAGRPVLPDYTTRTFGPLCAQLSLRD